MNVVANGNVAARIFAIAFVSTFVAIVVCLTWPVLSADLSSIRFEDFLAAIFYSALVSVIVFPLVAVFGILMHLLLKLVDVPRILTLPVFAIAGYLAGQFFINPSWAGTVPLSIGISTIAWLLYSFGPLRLWRIEFDSGSCVPAITYEDTND